MSSTWNILRDDIEDVAEAIKLRAIRDQCSQMVYVRPCGDMVTERAKDSRRKYPYDSAWLVGNYNRKARCRDIESDLMMRRGEIDR